MPESAAPSPAPHRRRRRYPGTHPRRFEEKYKERQPERYRETVARVIAAGKTPAGTHRPIMVREILEVLKPSPGNVAVDCTLGYGGHAQEILPRLQPGGHLLALDADPVELPRTEARLRASGIAGGTLTVRRSNFAGLPQILAETGFGAADLILADLGISSMQIDDPARGFSVKLDGPLDMRMNPQRGQPASELLGKISPDKLAAILSDHADEPRAATLAPVLAGNRFTTTLALAAAIRRALPDASADEADLAVRRVFQALRIAVNDEFSALETFLRNLPSCLKPLGRAAILTFHSGEDRRVKKSFATLRSAGVYAEIAEEVIRPSPEERNSNPRSSPAKLRWARRAV